MRSRRIRIPIQITWRYAAAVLVLVGLFTWLVVGGIVVIDSWLVPLTPTIPLLAASATAPRIATVKTFVPTVTAFPLETIAPTTTTPILVTAGPTALAVVPSPTVFPANTTDDADFATEAAATPDAEPADSNASANTCHIPDGWTAYDVQPGDTLFGFELGSKGQTNVAAILAGNCLTSKLLAIGQPIYLPPGAAENAPKIDDGPAAPSGSVPTGPTRTANCPCTLVVRAGWRLEQIAAAIDNTPVGFSGHDFLMATGAGAPAPDLEYLHSRPTGKSLEGFMFPGTYTLDNNTSAVGFRDMLLNAFAANVGGQMVADAAARGLTFWQVIVLASMVQRESYAPSEQKLIASVFYNRLTANKGIAATVSLQYALGRPGNWWPRIVGRMINIDSPYNTNIYLGLPPTAIASPGLDAIRAAVYPAQTDYQYFSAKCGGGGNFYTRTFQEFEQGLKCP